MSPTKEGIAGARFADPLSAFYIPITEQPADSGHRALKQGDSFAVLDARGDIPRTGRMSALGVFHRDTRHLSGFDILVEGRRPLLLSTSLQSDNVLLNVDLANPDIYRDGSLLMSRETLHIVRSKFLWQGTFNERISVQNFDLRPHRARLLIWFEADFADLFEVRGIKRSARGTFGPTGRSENEVVFRYRGLDGIDRHTRMHFDPTPSALTDNYAAYDISLAPHASQTFCVIAEFRNTRRSEDWRLVPRLLDAKRTVRRRAGQTASVTSTNEAFNQIISRSLSDLQMLITETPQGPYPSAGIPWFSTQFGRDGIIVALQTLWADPGIAKGVLRYLAATQAKVDDPARDAEPGKILHETRRGEMAVTGEVPFGQYYGSVDATPLFVILAGRYHRRTADLETIRAIWPNVEAALAWIDGPGDADKDGFIEYRARNEKGLGNQGWKDSFDSVMHADGRLAEGAIALCEVQSYVYLAKLMAADLAAALGQKQIATRLLREADELRARFESQFWCDDIKTYALALDGVKRPCRVRTSNAGQVLFGGIASPERARLVAQNLMSKEMHSGWGVRTLAQGEKRYNPMSYHNGSVWPHDNSLIAMGLARYGLKPPVLSIFRGLFESVHYLDDRRLPELFCGFPRRRGHAPTRYPVACSPQAWASGTLLALVDAMLGLEIDPLKRELRFRRPFLPPELNRIALNRVRVGSEALDVSIERHGETVSVNTPGGSRQVRILVEA